MKGGLRRLRFRGFDLDVQLGQLCCDGRPVKIQPQPFRVLVILAEHAGELVSRDELRAQIWDTSTFVEFDQGLNYCIRQIRLALGDDAANPIYLETVKKRGYRFVPPVTRVSVEAEPAPEIPSPPPASGSRVRFGLRPAALAVLLVVLALGGWLFPRWIDARHVSRESVRDIRQVTDFADSAVAPALSPDGRMIAFIRGDNNFLTPDQIYVKMLPDGEARRLTDDPRLKVRPDVLARWIGSRLHGAGTHGLVHLRGVGARRRAPSCAEQRCGTHLAGPEPIVVSQTKKGQHMGIVAGPDTGDGLRERYLPTHERAMAHYSYASPDRRSALVVEMDANGLWASCRRISLDGRFESRPVGPAGMCDAAGWSPDGQWMYFTAIVGGQHHLWRQRSTETMPEQLTFGPTSETGIAVDPDGKSLLTSIGVRESTLWIRDGGSNRQLSFEGQVASAGAFSADGQFVYLRAATRVRGAAA